MVQSVVTEILFYQYFDVVFQRRLPLGRPLFLVFCFLSLSLLPPIFKTPEGIIAGEQILHGLLSHQREQKLSMYLSTLVWLYNLTFQIRSVVAEIFQYQYFEVVFQSTEQVYTSHVQNYNWANQSLCTRKDKLKELDIGVHTEPNAFERFDEYAKHVDLN